MRAKCLDKLGITGFLDTPWAVTFLLAKLASGVKSRRRFHCMDGMAWRGHAVEAATNQSSACLAWSGSVPMLDAFFAFPTAQVSSPDPNWLYSSIVQSTAAIVAIVGGFILSTVLIRSADRDTLDSRISAKRNEVSALAEEERRCFREAERLRASNLLADEMGRLLGSDAPSSVEEAIHVLGAENIDADAFGEEWEAIAAQIGRARRFIRDNAEQYGIEEWSLDDWAERHGIQVPASEEWLIDRLFPIVRREIVPPQPAPVPSAGSWFSSPAYIASLRTEEMNRIEYQASLTAREEEAAAGRRTDDVAQRRRLAEAELKAFVEQRQAFRFPPHLLSGFGALGVLALLGIFVPLVIMPQSAAAFRRWHQLVVILLFLLGLVAVTAYCLSLVAPGRIRWPWRRSAGNGK